MALKQREARAVDSGVRARVSLNETRALRFLVAEDEPVLASRVARSLAPFGEVCLVDSVAEAAKRVAEQRWDGAVIDLGLRDGLAHAFVDALRAHSPAAALVVMSGLPPEEASAFAFERDAFFLAKPSASLAWIERFVAHAQRASLRVAAEAHGASAREAEALELYLSGKTRDEVAAVLGLSSTTIKSHLDNVCRKFNAPNPKAILFQLGGWRAPAGAPPGSTRPPPK